MDQGLKIYNDLHSLVRMEEDFVQRWIVYYRENLPQFAQEKIMNGDCLDAGCGGTVKGSLLIRHFSPASVTAADVNMEHAQYYTNEIAKFVHTDIASTGFEDEKFDFILCNGVIHHTPNPENTVKELARILKKNGAFCFSVYCFQNSMFHLSVSMLRFLAKFISFEKAKKLTGNNFNLGVLLDHAYVPYNYVYSIESFQKILDANGLKTLVHLNPSQAYARDKTFNGFLSRNERYLFGDGAIVCFAGTKQK